MTGMQTAYEGKYAAMLVPYSVIASTDEQAEVTDEEPGQEEVHHTGDLLTISL